MEPQYLRQALFTLAISLLATITLLALLLGLP